MANHLGNRPSSLACAEYCGLSGPLGARYGTGRAAVMGSVFHALCADAPDAADMLARLRSDEAVELLGWHKPADWIVPDTGEVATYASSEKEVGLAINRQGEACEPNSGTVWCQGTADIVWTVSDQDGPVAVVRDIKKQRWTVDGPDTLQLLCYGWMTAKKYGVSRFAVGLWLAVEGQYVSGPTVDVDGFSGAEVWSRLEHAIGNQSATGTTGSHCRSCYSRLHCKEWLLPTGLEPDLAALAEDAEVPVHPGNALEALLYVQGLEDKAKAAKATLQVWAERNGGIPDPERGKVWRHVSRKGAESVDLKALRAGLGSDAERFVKHGEPSSAPRWVKP